MSVEKKTEILRQRAEKILLTLPESDTDISRENIRHLIHELQVYQIELEIQNEELRNNQRILDDNRRRYFSLFDNAPVGYVILDQSGIIRQFNKTFAEMIAQELVMPAKKAFADLLLPEDAQVFRSRFKALLKNPKDKQIEARIISAHFKECYVLIKTDLHDGTPGSTRAEDQELLLTVMDITERKASEEDNKRLIRQLTEALGQVKQLCGLLPICSHCKKIRDDKGYWQEVEAYIHTHSEARFSHGICRECAKKYYPDFDLYEDKE